MLEAGEDRLAEGIEERGQSGGADEVLGECPAHQAALSQHAPNWTVRVAEDLHTAVKDLLVAASGDGAHLKAISQAQVAEHF